MTQTASRIPAFVNAASGSADDARSALETDPNFEVTDVKPDELGSHITKAIAGGATRVLVAGGDGTIATAAETLMSGETELAILPGGTLNHFARDLGISTEAKEALATASGGSCRSVDVGTVNGKLFLNTSSVGAYVRFVKLREYLEERFGYRLASAIAGLRTLFQFQLITVDLEVEGVRKSYRTPLVFIGVGERELQLPTLGNRVKDGKRGLHVIVVQGRSRSRIFVIAMAAMARGVRTAAKSPELDSFIVDRCTISRRGRGSVAIDGEIVTLDSPLQYELKRDSLRVVCP